MEQRNDVTVTVSPSGEIIRTLPVVILRDKQTGTVYAQDENNGYKYSIIELERIADDGDPAAQCAMGDYFNCQWNYNPFAAFDWYEKSANQNYAKAQWNMGNFYGTPRETVEEQFGKNAVVVEPDFDLAISWFVKSANQGYLEAMFHLGGVFFMNNDLANASKWLEKANEHGHPEAGTYLEMIRLLSR